MYFNRTEKCEVKIKNYWMNGGFNSTLNNYFKNESNNYFCNKKITYCTIIVLLCVPKILNLLCKLIQIHSKKIRKFHMYPIFFHILSKTEFWFLWIFKFVTKLYIQILGQFYLTGSIFPKLKHQKVA